MRQLEVLRVPPTVGIDCPAYVAQGLVDLVCGGKDACAFECVAVDAKGFLPERWFDTQAVAFVRRGFVARQRLDGQGRVSVVDVVGPGGLITLPERRKDGSTPQGVALGRVLACICARETFAEALRREEISRDYLRLQQVGMERMERLAEARARAHAESAVASLLCALADTLHGDGPTDLISSDVQQRVMASLLCVRHETVSRVLKALEARGLVRREAEGLRIVDRAALEAC